MKENFIQNKPIGIMGGAFNPFHNGHLRHAIEVFEHIPLAGIEILPSGKHPHKDKLLPFELRKKCIELAINNVNFLTINELENNIAGPSYTDKILKAWRKQNPSHFPYFLMGTEDFALLHSWNNGLTLPSIAHLLIVSRHYDSATYSCEIAKKYWNEVYINHELMEDPIPYLQSQRVEAENLNVETIKNLGFVKYTDQDLRQIKKLHIAVPYLGFCTYLDIPFLDITATTIRNLWKNNKCVYGLLPENCIHFLNENAELLKKWW